VSLPCGIAKRYLTWVFRRLRQSLHALGRDPAIYVLIKHFFAHFLLSFVHFMPEKSVVIFDF
jgi:hypothetical protein